MGADGAAQPLKHSVGRSRSLAVADGSKISVYYTSFIIFQHNVLSGIVKTRRDGDSERRDGDS